jgi:hypothetical protein
MAKQSSIKRRVGYGHKENEARKKREKMNVDDDENTGHTSIAR